MDSSTEDEEDDSQLKLAIALSLQDSPSATAVTTAKHTSIPIPSSKEIIDLSTDEDPIPLDSHPADPSRTAATAVGSAGHAFLGLDRKAMEQERLSRKRKALEPLPSATSDNQVCDNEDAPVSRERGMGLAAMRSDAHEARLPRTKHAKHEDTCTQPERLSSVGLRFPKGVVKKTWALGFPRQDDIKIEEVLERHDLTVAVLSSFQWDVEWLLSKVDVAKIRMIFVMQAKDEATKQQYRRETADMPTLRLCFPPMEGQVNCMHSKLMLLAHPSYLRVVVPTANLVPYDWGESGVMENMVFLIDLPRLPDNRTTAVADMTFFGQELVHFCKAMGLQEDVVNSLCRFDFSGTKRIAFVHTIGGAHTGDDEPWRRTGYPGLGRAVQHLGLNTEKALDIDFVASSIGAVNMDFLTMMYLAAQGDDGMREFSWRSSTSKSKSSKKGPKQQSITQTELINTIKKSFRIFFPSRGTVVRSKGGPACGGVICFSSKWYTAPSFPREVLRDCKSVRQGLLMHNKACIHVDALFIKAATDRSRSFMFDLNSMTKICQ